MIKGVYLEFFGLYVIPNFPVGPVNDRVTRPFGLECASLKEAAAVVVVIV